MKGITLLVLGSFIFGTSGYLIKVPVAPLQPRVGTTNGWIHLQKLILPLFENVCEESTDPIIIRLAQEFALNMTSGVYLKADVVSNFQKIRAKGFLPKGEIFTNYDFDHTNQLRAIYELFLFAKDFDTFYKSAAWARQNINCGIFVNAIYLAILNRRDTEKLSVPAPYEVLPNYFVQKDVILKASALLSGEQVVLSETVRDEGNSYVLDANYTSDFFETDSESKLAYFHEDIGLNCYYFLQKLKRSAWFNSAPEMHLNYGDYLYHMMKQLDARYSLERYANNLPEVEDINFKTFTAAPYDPNLIYSNGNAFGHRTRPLEIIDADNVELLQTIETNIGTVVTHMVNTGYNKSEILNHLMGILVTGERSYETLLKNSIDKDDTSSQPSVLQHYMTSVRDPVFWRLNKKIVNLVDEGMKNLPAYSRNELYFPGIEIINIDVKKMMTNFDYFQFDVTDALKTASTNTAFQVKIGQPRLNHKAFAMKLNISSLVTQKGLIKIYLGPKIAPGEFSSKKNLFMQLDNFECNFKIGTNIISRSSDEMKNLSGDFTSLRTFRKQIEDAEFGLDVVPLVNTESLSQFPSRLILPKGTSEGVTLQMFVFVAPFLKSTFSGLFSVPTMDFNAAILTPGYPLDLNIEDSQLFNLPNAMIKDVIVTHKGDKVSNYGGTGVTSKWTKTSDEQYTAKKKEPFDYTSKKGQYGEKEDYAAKRKEAFDYNAKKNQYEKKVVVITDDTEDRNVDEHPTESTKIDGTETIQDFTTNISYKTVDLRKDEYFDKDVIKQDDDKQKETLARESEEYDIPEIDQNLLTIQEPYTRTPSVYDYIRHPEYYDTDLRVYE